jgi:hypothetical protein
MPCCYQRQGVQSRCLLVAVQAARLWHLLLPLLAAPQAQLLQAQQQVLYLKAKT